MQKDEVHKLYVEYGIGHDPDSLSIVSFVGEFNEKYSINLFEYDLEKITDLEYLYTLINNDNW